MLDRLRYGHRFLYVGIKTRHVDRFLAGTARCAEIQRQQLFKQLSGSADSDFGRDHGFSRIQTIEDYRRHVPIATYEYYRPYAEKVKRGNTGAMFGPKRKVLMFSVTSGTTSEPKYIPITDQFFEEYRRGWNLWGLRVFRDHPELVSKHTLQLTSDWQRFLTVGGIPCGNISGLAVETRPRISNPMFLLPSAVNKVRDTASKHYTTLRLSLASRKVGMISTANPLTLLNLARLADEQSESLIRDLHNGTLSEHVEIPNEVRSSLNGALRGRHPERARELDQIVCRTGHLFPRDFWPNLSVLAVWTGGPVAVYLSKVSEYYGHAVFRDHGLSASEGRMTTPFGDNTSAGLLDYTTHYFEFIPEEEHDRRNPTILESHELEEGRDYYILLTTSSGLYRYDIHDVVRCVGYRGTCPILDFQNKGAHFSNMTGEKLGEVQIVHAAKRAFDEFGLAIEHFMIAPVTGDPAHYVLLIEESLKSEAKDRLARRVDVHLSHVNCEYEDRLATQRLGPLCVQQVPCDTWAKLRARRLARLGGSPEQYKHTFLTGDTNFLNQILRPADRRHRVDAQHSPGQTGTAFPNTGHVPSREPSPI
jgi:hypothetical protein